MTRLMPFFASLLLCAFAFGAEPVSVQLNSASIAPREMEDNTEKAVVRDYTRAWQSLATALSENRSAALANDFIGHAQDELRQRVSEQQKSGLHTRYIDHGHNLQALFYSQDGSAMQLRDTARLEVQMLDGDKVIHSDQFTQNYLVVMTTGENRWKVRVLQALPAAK
jgi:hypothetical protein